MCGWWRLTLGLCWGSRRVHVSWVLEDPVRRSMAVSFKTAANSHGNMHKRLRSSGPSEVRVRKLIMQLQLTLDGFYAGSNGEFDWFTLDQEGWRDRVHHSFPQIGTVLLGRKNYQGFRQYWPRVAQMPDVTDTDLMFSRWLDDIPKIVFSTTLNGAPWENSRLSRDLVGEVRALKEGEGGDLLIMHSASIGQACMARGLVDEFWLTVHPVALGHGLPLFTERIQLALLESRVYSSGQVFLRYRTVALDEETQGAPS